MKPKEEAEKAVLDAYKQVADLKGALENFARVCYRAHKSLSDGEMSKLINFGYSRSRIQQWRNEQKRKDDASKPK